MWAAFYGVLSVALLAGTWRLRRKFSAQFIVALVLFGSWALTNMLDYLSGYRITSIINPYIHAFGGSVAIVLWERHKKGQNWLLGVSTLFMLAVCADFDLNATALTTQHLPPQSLYGYVLAQNVLFLARMIVTGAGPLGYLWISVIGPLPTVRSERSRVGAKARYQEGTR